MNTCVRFTFRLMTAFMVGFMAMLPSGFCLTHPGALNSKAELDFIKAKVNGGQQPWKSDYDKLLTLGSAWGGRTQNGSLASLSYQPHPHSNVSKEEPAIRDDYMNDCAAAYCHAIQWYVTGNTAHADKVIQICNAWSVTLKSFSGIDQKLLPAWSTPMIWGAEIVRNTTTRWSATDIARFQAMLDNVIYPLIRNGSGNNPNWQMSMATTCIAIGIFENDTTKFNQGITLFDGKLGTTIKSDGQLGELCRDLDHASMGLNAAATAAEQAWHQGVDLYSRLGNRILMGAEHTARILNGSLAAPCTLNGSFAVPSFELIYNHYHNRKGLSLPNTEKLWSNPPSRLGAAARRPEAYHMFYGWGTLTHHGNTGSGTPINTPPSVSLTAPAAGTTYLAPASVSIAASATDSNGTITKVEFLTGSSLIGADSSSPYAITWTGVAAGAYQLSARATDNGGATTTSAGIQITVNSSGSSGGTSTTLGAVADAYVRDGTYAPSNFGNVNQLQAKADPTAGFTRRSYLKFDVTSVGSITKATLRLYGSTSSTSGVTHSDSVYAVSNNSWTESGITWNNKPLLETKQATATVTATGQYISWDVTAFVKSQKTAGNNVISLAVTMDAPASDSSASNFNSREAGANAPQLLITP